MVKSCPLCKGEKEIPVSNGTTDGKEQQECNVCGGRGEVDERPSHKIHIVKYWGEMVG